MAQRLSVMYDKKPCYVIVITKGFEEINEEIAQFVDKSKKVCIISDSIVSPLYAEGLAGIVKEFASSVCTYAIPAGRK